MASGVKIDPVTILTMGMDRIPGHRLHRLHHVLRTVRRRPPVQTVDQMLGGRAAWNVVTSVNDGEAHNMGRAVHVEHDLRYDRADEFMEIVLGRWDGWEDDASSSTRPPDCSRIPTRSTAWNTRGNTSIARPVHGAPLAAGPSGHHPGRPSGRGQTFAARWAERCSSAITTSRQAEATTPTSRPGRHGRPRPGPGIVAAGAYPVVAETRAEAEDKVALIDKLPKEIDSLSLLSEALNFDSRPSRSTSRSPGGDSPAWTGVQAMRDRVMQVSGRQPTMRDFMEITSAARPRPSAFVGSPKDVANGMEEWFAERACDGFVVAASHVPGAYEDSPSSLSRNCNAGAAP